VCSPSGLFFLLSSPGLLARFLLLPVNLPTRKVLIFCHACCCSSAGAVQSRWPRFSVLISRRLWDLNLAHSVLFWRSIFVQCLLCVSEHQLDPVVFLCDFLFLCANHFLPACSLSGAGPTHSLERFCPEARARLELSPVLEFSLHFPIVAASLLSEQGSGSLASSQAFEF
jgi:hypothetical protein